MSWLGAAGQELDEPQQQALLRIVAAANQNAGADDSEEDDREFVGDLDDFEEEEELDDSDDAEAFEQYDDGAQPGDEEVEEGIVEEIDEDDEEEELDATQQAELMKLMQQAQMIRGLEPTQPSTRGAPSAAAAAAQEHWSGLTSMPEPTRLSIEQALQQIKAHGRGSLNMLVLGKAFAGKTATINSMLGEAVFDVKPMADVAAKVSMVTRTALGVTLRVIDTPPLTEGDSVNQTALDMVAHAVRQEGWIDVVLYVDRLDGYRVSPLDKEVLSAVSDTLGRGVWENVVLGLTHAEYLPVNVEYETFVDDRAEGLRKAIAAAGAPKEAVLPLVLIDNRRNGDTDHQGQKVLPDGRPWLPMMVSEVVQAALDVKAPFKYDPKQRQAANPNNRRKWLIPVVLVAQFLFKVLVLDRILEEDGITGDAYGPYDPEYIEDERARRKEEREADKRAAVRRKAKKSGGKAKAPASTPLVVVEEASSSSESDDDEADFDLDA